MAGELAIAAPRAEEMTKVAVSLGGAVVSGLAEGVVIKFAPGLGALKPLVEWGTLLGVPLIGVAGALFTRGMIGDLFTGVAAGGCGVLGYVLPSMIAPYMPTERKLGGGPGGVKQLPAGAMSAAERAQVQVRAGMEF